MLDPNISQTQACSTCREVKPFGQFHRNSNKKSGVVSKCKDCVKAYNAAQYAANRDKRLAWQKEYHDNHREEIRQQRKARSQRNKDNLAAIPLTDMVETQMCSVCDEVKPLGQFHRNFSRDIGVKRKCRDCANEQGRIYSAANHDKEIERSSRYREANREAINERSRQRRAKNPEDIRIRDRRYREKNHDIILERSRQRYAQNRDAESEYRKAWRTQNPEKARASVRRWYAKNRDYELRRNQERAKTPEGRERGRMKASLRRARLLGATVGSVRPISQMIQEQGHKCYLCGRRFTKADPAVIEHYVPLAKGGEHTDANTLAAHKSCNSRKQALAPEVYAKRNGRLLI